MKLHISVFCFIYSSSKLLSPSDNFDYHNNFLVLKIVASAFHVLQSYVMTGSVKERQLFDLISQMLKYKPSERITVADALCHPFFSSIDF